MAAKGEKKAKKKGKTMALTDFLSDPSGNVQGPGSSYVLANKSVDWAAEMEEADFDSDPSYGGGQAIDRAKLPTAPKASRGPEDLSKVPTEPPFTAFIGNLPYEATEEKIEEFFGKLPVVNVRLPDDNGRLRGFGYVQFETRQALIDALSMADEIFGGRKMRIDLAGESQHGGDNRKGGRNDGMPDRTEGDWRSGPSGGTSESAFGDRGGSRYDDRGPSRYDDRGPSRYDDRGSNSFERGPSQYDDRGPSRGGDDRGFGGGGRYNDRGGSRDDRGFSDRSRYGDRDDRGGSSFGRRDDRSDGGSRGFGSGFRRDDRDDGGSWERGSGFSGDRYAASDRGRDGGRDRPAYGGDRPAYGGDRDRERASYDRDDRYSRPEQREAEAPKERPRLNLQPRTKPVEAIEVAEPPKESEPVPKPRPVVPKPSAASIFGSAKPVDTAQREREIEERMRKQKLDGGAAPSNKSSLESRGYGSSRGYEEPKERKHETDNKESRNTSRVDGGSRHRSGSDRSEDGDIQRRRRSSGSSKKKGSFSSSSRSRQDSGEQIGHSEVFSGGEEAREDKSHNAISPAYREEQVKLVPAPPPKENIWEKRKQHISGDEPASPPVITPPVTATAAPPTSHQPRSPTQPKQQQQPAKPSTQQPPAPTHKPEPAAGKTDEKREFVPAEPPKENVWARRKQDQGTPAGSAPAPAPAVGAPAPVHNVWAGRGGSGGQGASERGRGGRGAARGGAGFGRGRGSEPPQRKPEKKERPLPQSIDDMPKADEKKDKDFSNSNKFAGLLDDDDGGVDAES